MSAENMPNTNVPKGSSIKNSRFGFITLALYIISIVMYYLVQFRIGIIGDGSINAVLIFAFFISGVISALTGFFWIRKKFFQLFF
jgi:hypothetical protein